MAGDEANKTDTRDDYCHVHGTGLPVVPRGSAHRGIIKVGTCTALRQSHQFNPLSQQIINYNLRTNTRVPKNTYPVRTEHAFSAITALQLLVTEPEIPSAACMYSYIYSFAVVAQELKV